MEKESTLLSALGFHFTYSVCCVEAGSKFCIKALLFLQHPGESCDKVGILWQLQINSGSVLFTELNMYMNNTIGTVILVVYIIKCNFFCVPYIFNMLLNFVMIMYTCTLNVFSRKIQCSVQDTR